MAWLLEATAVMDRHAGKALSMSSACLLTMSRIGRCVSVSILWANAL